MRASWEFKNAYLQIYQQGHRWPQSAVAYIYHLLARRIRPAARSVIGPVELQHLNTEIICQKFKQELKNDFGKLAKNVLYDWGINSYSQLGQIIFALAENKCLVLQESDRLEDYEKAGNIELE